MRERWPRLGCLLPEDGEEAGGACVEVICGDGLDLAFINLNPPSPPAMPINERSARHALSGSGTDPLKAF